MDNLEARVRRIVARLGVVPSRAFACQVEYWKEVVAGVEQSEPWHQYLAHANASAWVKRLEIPIPSFEQKRVGIAIATKRKVMDLSAPGSRKTIAALSALVPIREECPEVKTLVSCPGYIIPNWLREIERAIPHAQPVVITCDNREEAIEMARAPTTDFVIVSTDMMYRKSSLSESVDPARVSQYLLQYPTVDAAYARLVPLVGQSRVNALRERISQRRINWYHLVERIVLEESKVEVDPIHAVLAADVFTTDRKYYAILDEFHNIVHASGKKADALALLLKNAHWCALLSGTGISNKPEDLSYAAAVLGFVSNPEDFRVLVKKDMAKSRAFIDQYATHPIYRLQNVDPLVPSPEEHEVPHSLSPEEIAIQSALLNDERFEGGEKYLLLNYLNLNPRKLLPENLTRDERATGPLITKVRQLFANQPSLRTLVECSRQSRFEEIERIVESLPAHAKFGIVSEYTHLVTEELAARLDRFGVLAITSEDGVTQREIRLTSQERRMLEEKHFLSQDLRFRSQLSRGMREALGVEYYEILELAGRDKKILTFVTNPDIRGFVTSYGVLREGHNIQELDVIIEAEPTTVPSTRVQFIHRAVRSGQRKTVQVLSPFVPGTIDVGRRTFRVDKQSVNERLLYGADLSMQDMNNYLATRKRPEDFLPIKHFLGLNSYAVVSLIFSRLQGAGTQGFVNSMMAYNTAYLLADNYNREWEGGFSANNGRLCAQLIDNLENKMNKVDPEFAFRQVIDLGCGPLVMNRLLKRPTLNVDVNRFQMQFGVAGVDKASAGTNYLGSATDLTRLVALEDTKDVVFDPRKNYAKTFRVDDKSIDVAVASCLLYFLDSADSYRFFSEVCRVLRPGGYVLISNPSHKVHPDCVPQFLEDIEQVGFEVDHEVTGAYASDKFTVIDPDKRPQEFEAHVVLARKRESPSYGNVRPAFQLSPDYKVHTVSNHPDRNVDCGQRPSGIHCDGFYKIDTGFRPKELPGNDSEEPFSDDFFVRLEKILRGS